MSRSISGMWDQIRHDLAARALLSLCGLDDEYAAAAGAEGFNSRRKLLAATTVVWLALAALDWWRLPAEMRGFGGAWLLLQAVRLPALLALIGVTWAAWQPRRSAFVDRALPCALMLTIASTSIALAIHREYGLNFSLPANVGQMLLLVAILLAPFGLPYRLRTRIAATYLLWELAVGLVAMGAPRWFAEVGPGWVSLAAIAALCSYCALLQERDRIAHFLSEQRLDELVRHLPIAMCTACQDPDGRLHLLHIAGATEHLFGLNNAALLAEPFRHWKELIHPDDRERVHAYTAVTLRRRVPHVSEYRAAGEPSRWIRCEAHPRKLADGVTQWTGYWMDVTETHARTEALRTARRTAESASQAKASFLAMMSHEIRTPMASVLGMIELLGRGKLDHDQRYLLRTVDDSATALLRILDDVLDFSRIEAGKLSLDIAPFDPRALLDHVLGMVARNARSKGLQLRLAIDSRIAGELEGDAWRLRQIILNLLYNACKFTEHGQITVTLQMRHEDATQQWLRISVSDTGIGITPEQQQKLFAPFTQAMANANGENGTGLGLAICRRLAELMQGTIVLHSEPNVGTRIDLEVPLTVHRQSVRTAPALHGRVARIRLRDLQLAAALAEMLHTLGLHPQIEIHPPHHDDRRHADLLFTDSPAHSDDPPARVHVAERPHPLGFGRDHERLLLSSNPLRWGALAPVCREALGMQPHDLDDEEPVAPVAPAIEVPSPRILVAEDHPVNQLLVQRQLAALGYECDLFADGEQALAALERGGYAMLITDCHMPKLDGYDLTRHLRLRERASGTHLPVIAMTANAFADAHRQCREAGMDDYLSKPVRLQRLREVLARWLHAASAPITAPPLETATVVDGIDLGLLVHSFGSPQAAHDILDLLATTTLADIDRLDQLQQAGDPHAIALCLHRIFGAFRVLGSPPLLEDGFALERALLADDGREALWQVPLFRNRLYAFACSLRELQPQAVTA